MQEIRIMDEDDKRELQDEIDAVRDKLNAFLDIDDTTKDQVSEIIALIEDNRDLIDSITTGKVSVTDIVDNLATNAANKPLSAAQGVALKALIDAIKVPTKVSALTNDAGYIKSAQLDSAVDEALTEAKESGEFDGPPGAPGESAYAAAKAAGYTGTAEEFAAALAVVASGGGSGGGSAEYETVDSVDEMTDTSKQYVLKETGTIWAYGEFNETVNVNEQIFDASKVFTGHISGVNITSSSNKMYPMPVDVSKIPEGVDVYVDIKGFYVRNTTSPSLEKVGYSALENPKQADSQVISGAYAAQSSSSGYLKDAISATSDGCKIKVGYIDNAKLSAYDTIKTMLLEVKADQTHDASKITAYLQYNYSGTVAKWYDTELALSTGGGGGGNLIALTVKVNQNAANICDLTERVGGLENAGGVTTIPTYWADAYTEAVEKVKALQDAGGDDVVNFLYFSDLHYHPSSAYIKNIGILCRALLDELDIPFALMTGDTMSAAVVTAESILLDYLDGANTLLAPINDELLRLRGNHDDVWGSYTNGDTTTSYVNKVAAAKMYNKLHRKQARDFRRVFGGNGSYFCIDTPQRVRFVCLNSHYYDGEAITGGTTGAMTSGFGADQLAWLRDEALAVGAGVSVVIATHIPPTAQPVNGRTYYLSQISDGADFREIITASTADIVGIFCGHCHADAIVTGDLPCPIITITCAINTAYDSAEPARQAGTDTETALDIVSINKATRTITLVRLGVGVSAGRSCTY